MRAWMVAVLAAVALLAQAQQDAAKGKAKGKGRAAADAKPPVPPPEPQVLRLVRPDLYLVTGEGGNSVFRAAADGVTLVDTKLAKAGNFERLRELIRGVTPLPVKIVLNTHDHPDHAGNNARFEGLVASADPRLVRLPAAHTGSDRAVLFADLRVVVAGDVITAGAPLADEAAGGTRAGLAQAVDAILALQWDVAIPGHGEPMTRAQVQEYRKKLGAQQ